MQWTLVTINLPASEVHIDKVWSDPAALVAFADDAYPGWTSLVVTVLPAPSQIQ